MVALGEAGPVRPADGVVARPAEERQQPGVGPVDPGRRAGRTRRAVASSTRPTRPGTAARRARRASGAARRWLAATSQPCTVISSAAARPAAGGVDGETADAHLPGGGLLQPRAARPPCREPGHPRRGAGAGHDRTPRRRPRRRRRGRRPCGRAGRPGPSRRRRRPAQRGVGDRGQGAAGVGQGTARAARRGRAALTGSRLGAGGGRVVGGQPVGQAERANSRGSKKAPTWRTRSPSRSSTCRWNGSKWPSALRM